MPDQEPERDRHRICLFGGTFDPIHCAHLRIACEAERVASLDQVLFVPAGRPPHKPQDGLTPFADRFRMVELACEAYPKFEASRLEERDLPSYTVDTVRRMLETLKPTDSLYFLIGADAFDEIESWHDWHQLISMVKFIVVTRPGGSYRIPKGAHVTPLNGLELDVSSSAIRARIAEGEPTPELPVKVRQYIDEKHLYQAVTPS